MTRSNGFNLIEMMIVVAIIAVLAAIAFPNYQDYVIRTRRASATGCLTELAQFMERYYTTNMTYVGAALPNIACRGELSKTYTFEFAAAVTASTYSLRAVPKGPQTADTACGTLSLNQAGARSQTGAGTRCW